jgi:hypothetical protein
VDNIIKKLKKIKSERIVKINVFENKEIEFFTESGISIKITEEDKSIFSTFEFNNMDKIIGEKVWDIEINSLSKAIIISMYKNENASIIVEGVKEIIETEKSKDGFELKVKVDTYRDDVVDLIYFKRGEKWVLSEFANEEYEELIKVLDAFDFINHPNMRMHTLF